MAAAKPARDPSTRICAQDWKSWVIALDVLVTGHLRREPELPRVSPALRMERPHRHNLAMCSLELIDLGFWPSLEVGLPSTHTISLTRTVDDRNLPTHMARMARHPTGD
jgi:hypothetical protein